MTRTHHVSRPRSHSHSIFKGIAMAYKHRKHIIRAGRKFGEYVKHGYKRSRVMEEKEHKPREGKTVDLHGEINKEYHAIVLKHKAPKKVIGSQKQELFWDNCNQFIGTNGLTTYQQILSLDTNNQWLVSSGSGFNSGQADISWYDYNYNRVTTGSSLYGAASPANDEYALMKTLVTFDYADTSNAASFMKLHVYEAVGFVDDGPLVTWATQNGLNALGTSIFVAPTAASAGAATSGYGGFATTSSAVYAEKGNGFVSARPDLNINIKKQWKKLRTFSFDCAGGANHRMVINVIHNVCRHRGTISEVSQAYMKGSVVFVLEGTGQVVYDADAGQNAIHCAARGAYSIKCKTVFRPVRANASRLFTQFVTSHEASNTVAAVKIVDNNDAIANYVNE